MQLRPLTYREIDAAHAEAEDLTTKIVDQVLRDTANHLRSDVITENDLTIITRFWTDHVPELLDLVGSSFHKGAAYSRAEMQNALAQIRSLTAAAAAPAQQPDDVPVSAAVAAATADFHVPPIPNEAADQLLANAENRLVRTGNDVWEATRQQLHEGMLAGEGTLKLRERVMSSGPFAAPRALTIARSEVGHAMNQGSIGQMRQIDLPMTKEWLAVHDARTRPEHAEVDGEKVDLNATFSIGFDPGDDYNCRCTTGFDVPDENGFVDAVTSDDIPSPTVDTSWTAAEAESDQRFRSLYNDQEERFQYWREQGEINFAHAAQEWKRGSYTPIQQALYAGKTSGELDGYNYSSLGGFLHDMDQTFDEFVDPIQQDLVVRRNTSSDFTNIRTLLNGEVGDIYESLGYTAASAADHRTLSHMSLGGDVEMLIRVPAGSKVLSIDAANMSGTNVELEVLINRGATFRLAEPARKEGDRWMMTLELV